MSINTINRDGLDRQALEAGVADKLDVWARFVWEYKRNVNLDSAGQNAEEEAVDRSSEIINYLEDEGLILPDSLDNSAIENILDGIVNDPRVSSNQDAIRDTAVKLILDRIPAATVVPEELRFAQINNIEYFYFLEVARAAIAAYKVKAYSQWLQTKKHSQAAKNNLEKAGVMKSGVLVDASLAKKYSDGRTLTAKGSDFVSRLKNYLDNNDVGYNDGDVAKFWDMMMDVGFSGVLGPFLSGKSSEILQVFNGSHSDPASVLENLGDPNELVLELMRGFGAPVHDVIKQDSKTRKIHVAQAGFWSMVQDLMGWLGTLTKGREVTLPDADVNNDRVDTERKLSPVEEYNQLPEAFRTAFAAVMKAIIATSAFMFESEESGGMGRGGATTAVNVDPESIKKVLAHLLYKNDGNSLTGGHLFKPAGDRPRNKKEEAIYQRLTRALAGANSLAGTDDVRNYRSDSPNYDAKHAEKMTEVAAKIWQKLLEEGFIFTAEASRRTLRIENRDLLQAISDVTKAAEKAKDANEKPAKQASGWGRFLTYRNAERGAYVCLFAVMAPFATEGVFSTLRYDGPIVRSVNYVNKKYNPEQADDTRATVVDRQVQGLKQIEVRVDTTDLQEFAGGQNQGEAARRFICQIAVNGEDLSTDTLECFPPDAHQRAVEAAKKSKKK